MFTTINLIDITVTHPPWLSEIFVWLLNFRKRLVIFTVLLWQYLPATYFSLTPIMKLCQCLLLLMSFLSVVESLRVVPSSPKNLLQSQRARTNGGKLNQPSDSLPRTSHNQILQTQTRSQQRFYSDLSNGELIGEDAATFDLSQQSLKSWGTFLVAVGGILSFLFYMWIYDQGPMLGDQFKIVMESLAGGDTTLTITYMLAFFAVAHSGMASLRPAAEKIIGKNISKLKTFNPVERLQNVFFLH